LVDSVATSTGNLPLPLTTLVGREHELENLVHLLSAARIVTLVGPGGSGKTRLALAAGTELATRFPDGAWWVELGSLDSAHLVAATVAGATEAPQTPGDDTTSVVVRHLRGRTALIVLDNCEHVVSPAAGLAAEILGTCPDVRILATSREVLGIPGEHVQRLAGLDSRVSADGLGGAVRLFVERAAASVPGYAPGPEELTLIQGLCDQLDGLPLGIELAAARVGVLPVAEIATRLRNDALLRHPNRTAPERHKTLESTLDWSHRLLTPAEQVLFRRLAVFQGSFSLLAVESVAAGAPIGTPDVLPLLGSLVDKSLVQVADRGVEHRYVLLETFRHYAAARLAGSEDDQPLGRAHADFYTRLAAQAHAGLEGSDQPRWMDRLSLEHENLRAVLRRHLPLYPEVGGRLGALLWPFWYRRGYYHEARAWLEQAVAVADRMGSDVAAEVLTGAGMLAFLQCDYGVATDRLTRALALHEEAGHRVGVAIVRQRLGSIAREQGRYEEAFALHESSRALWSELGDAAGVAVSEDFLSFVAWLTGDLQSAEIHAGAALSYFEAAGRPQELAAALVNHAAAAHYAGRDEEAADELRRALEVSRRIGYLEGTAWALHELGLVERDTAASARCLAESLAVHAQLGDRWRVASVLESVAALVLVDREPRTAVQLLAAALRLRETLGAAAAPIERPAVERAMTTLRGYLGDDAFSAGWAEGEALSIEAAVQVAALGCRVGEGGEGGEPSGGDLTGSAATVLAGLTGREIEVLRLLSRGLTNREIGESLFISPGTAGVHVSNILRKLGVSGRVQAAGIAHKSGLD
jgi:predicted ATPase/DNA-binding CsgD family transcriptional regulator